MGDMLARLGEYYREARISAEGFDCPHAPKCKSVCNTFVPAQEAFIGSMYETGELSRLLFVSLDQATDSPEPSSRTLRAARDWEENECDPEKLPKGRHWYETHKLAHDLLNPVAIQRKHGSINFRDIHKYFAHTNSAKCKDAAQGTEQGRDVLFNNCREFLGREVELLRPDVIITQGDWARLAIERSPFEVIRTVPHPEYSKYCYRLIRLNGKPVLKISTYHPANYGKFYPEKTEAYPWYCRVAYEFLTEERGALA